MVDNNIIDRDAVTQEIQAMQASQIVLVNNLQITNKLPFNSSSSDPPLYRKFSKQQGSDGW